MTFTEISPKINVDALKMLGQLNQEQLNKKTVRDAELEAIIKGEDSRLLLIVGPCSADNQDAVLEYAHRLAKLQDQVKDKIFMVMRVYTAKPRTTGEGYKGLIHNNGSDLINGIRMVRDLHYQVISQTGLTTADEMLYPENLHLVDDLVSYFAVGARSVENQQHRFVASGIDAPIGLKNPMSGYLKAMFNGIYVAQHEQDFLFGRAEVKTNGNELAHAILRGGQNENGKSIPNYYTDNLHEAIDNYKTMNLKHPFIIVDANHDNSGKQYMEQIRIVRQTLLNRDWDEAIKKYVRGFMIESYLEDGRQDSPEVFGKSITDACLGWDKTEKLIKEIYQAEMKL
ncbi:MAG: 3-deoxy-7-phosphoheptulonate synthase [Streptococcaceae bacterium]|nr:3-deoxy-7-phosphoheptulonate synthase [Streptococcaceae bacterium]